MLLKTIELYAEEINLSKEEASLLLPKLLKDLSSLKQPIDNYIETEPSGTVTLKFAEEKTLNDFKKLQLTKYIVEFLKTTGALEFPLTKIGEITVLNDLKDQKIRGTTR